MKKILITGATGFIGRFLVDEARKRGYEITAAVRKTSNVQYLENKNIKILQVEFADGDNLKKAVRRLPRFDYVIHNAGLTKSLKKKDYFDVNEKNTGRLISALLEPGKIPDKFLLMSSLAAFGPGDPENGYPVLLTSPPRPVTAYGESKLAAEKLLAGEPRLPYVIIRPTAVYGPGEKDIFRIIKLANRGVEFQAGGKNQRLTFIYVKDLARLVFDALESSGINKAYFATDGNLYERAEMGRMIARLLDRTVRHIALPVVFLKMMGALSELAALISGKPPALTVDKVNELAAGNWNCDVEPLRADLNFQAEYNLETGLQETLDWRRKEK